MCSVQCIAQELKQEPYTSILILSNKTCKQFYWEWLRENTKLPGLEITIAIMILQENDNICFVNVNSITNIIVYHDQHWIAKTHCGTDKSKHIYVTSFGEKQKKNHWKKPNNKNRQRFIRNRVIYTNCVWARIKCVNEGNFLLDYVFLWFCARNYFRCKQSNSLNFNWWTNRMRN